MKEIASSDFQFVLRLYHSYVISTVISSTVGTVTTIERAVWTWNRERNKSKARFTRVPHLILKFSFLAHWMSTILVETTVKHKHIYLGLRFRYASHKVPRSPTLENITLAFLWLIWTWQPYFLSETR